MQNMSTAPWGNYSKLSMPQIRPFHMSWFPFFLGCFVWFGIAALMVVVWQELQLTNEPIGWSIIASVGITIFAGVMFGWFCDRAGPQLANMPKPMAPNRNRKLSSNRNEGTSAPAPS